jgi:hypothetical protein
LYSVPSLQKHTMRLALWLLLPWSVATADTTSQNLDQFLNGVRRRELQQSSRMSKMLPKEAHQPFSLLHHTQSRQYFKSYDPLDQGRGLQQHGAEGSSFRQIKVQQDTESVFRPETDWDWRTDPVVSIFY